MEASRTLLSISEAPVKPLNHDPIIPNHSELEDTRTRLVALQVSPGTRCQKATVRDEGDMEGWKDTHVSGR